MVARHPASGRATITASSLLFIVITALVSACSDELRADGQPCVSAFDCRSGQCLARPAGGRVCVARCASSSECAAGEVCGRFDFRGRDDGGLPAGPLDDVVRVCRAPLSARCTAGCAPGEVCTGDGGVCARRCESSVECGGRDCVAMACGVRRCAAPCDHLSECPSGETCNLATLDVSGHGQCIPLDDASVATDAACVVDP